MKSKPKRIALVGAGAALVAIGRALCRRSAAELAAEEAEWQSEERDCTPDELSADGQLLYRTMVGAATDAIAAGKGEILTTILPSGDVNIEHICLQPSSKACAPVTVQKMHGDDIQVFIGRHGAEADDPGGAEAYVRIVDQYVRAAIDGRVEEFVKHPDDHWRTKTMVKVDGVDEDLMLLSRNELLRESFPARPPRGWIRAGYLPY